MIYNDVQGGEAMSKYTTGEIAKLCNVSVRTVQYYDDRGILIPSELSEGGRRLYTDDDLKRMHIICFLREIGLPINSICISLSAAVICGIVFGLLPAIRAARLDPIQAIRTD